MATSNHDAPLQTLASSASAQPCRLLQLPVELIVDVCSKATQGALLSLVRTCKEASEIAIRSLYTHPLIRESGVRDSPPLAMRAFFAAVSRREELRNRVRSIRWLNAWGDFWDSTLALEGDNVGLREVVTPLPNCDEVSLSFLSPGGASVDDTLDFAIACAPAAHTFRLNEFGYYGEGVPHGYPPHLKRIFFTSISLSEDDAMDRIWSTVKCSVEHLTFESGSIYPQELESLCQLGATLTSKTLWLTDMDADEYEWDRSTRLADAIPLLRSLTFRPSGILWVLDDEPFASLQELQLELESDIDVRKVTRHLSMGMFPSLQRVGVWVTESRLGSAISEGAEEALVACRAVATERSVPWSVEKPDIRGWM